MIAIFTHMPFWVYYLLIGMFWAFMFVMMKRHLPTWVRTLSFVGMVLGWPAGLPLWLGWSIVPDRK